MAVAGGADSAGRRCRCHGYLQLCLESEVIHVIWPSTPPLPQHGLVHAHHGHGGGELLSGRAKESGLLRTTLNNTLRARAMAENSQELLGVLHGPIPTPNTLHPSSES